MRTRDENKELSICQKAMEMIVNNGFDGLSMQKLAKAANVSPATIYIYFKDREDLILQICLRVSERMIEATLKDFNSSMHFEEGLRTQWKNRAAYCLQYPLEAQFLEQIRHSPYGEKVFAPIKKEFSSAMGVFLNDAINRKELLKLPIEVYWSVAFSPLYTLIKFHTTGKGISEGTFIINDDLIEQTFKLVLKALTP